MDDVIQETAARAIRVSVPFEDAEDLYRWCSVVARRLVVDEHRRSSRVTVVHKPPEGAVPDIADGVYRREQVRQLAVELRGLTENDRELVLLGRPGRAMTNGEMVRRHRLRSRLAHAIGGLGAVIGWLRRRAPLARTVVATATAAPLFVILGIESFVVPVPEGRDRARLADPRVAVESSWRAPARLSSSPVGNRNAPGRKDPGNLAGDRYSIVASVPPVGGHRADGRLEDGDDSEAIVCLGGNPELSDLCVGNANDPLGVLDGDSTNGANS